jgi:hypothetical protein
MKRWLIFPALLVSALTLSASGLADPGEHDKGKDKDKGKTQKPVKGKSGVYGPFTFENTDNGSCGHPWATLMETRTFTVKSNGDGTYRVSRRDRGTFKTIGGVSPGACETTSKHGHTVRPNVTGKFHGSLVGTVTGGTFNPNAVCSLACGSDTGVFVTTVFGPNAQFSCFSDSKDCKFNYEYSAPAQSLIYHHWQDRGTGAGTMLKEVFKGDIANA